jgi:hypothetical protein
MPLQQLVEHDAIEESAQAEAEQQARVAQLCLFAESGHPTS